jgi:hypothetical protein
VRQQAMFCWRLLVDDVLWGVVGRLCACERFCRENHLPYEHGPISHSFGPAMRFLHGAHYAASQIARDIIADEGSKRASESGPIQSDARQAA